MIRMGIIGCGAAVQQLHLPPLLQSPGIQVVALADVNGKVAMRLASRYGVSQVVSDYTEVKDVDAVLVATPHYLHAPVSEFFLMKGVHVLCEKPLTTNLADADRLLQVAKENGAKLAVGVFRRYYPSSAFVKKAIQREWLGPIQSVDVEEGGQYGWALQSRFMMERDKAGGGVLTDTGAHTLDRLLWWFDSPPTKLDEYLDNSAMGVETDCAMHFKMQWKGRDIPVRCELSRTRVLRNSYRIMMQGGVLEVPVNAPCDLSIYDERLGKDHRDWIRLDLCGADSAKDRDVMKYFQNQIEDFLSAIQTGGGLVNDGATARAVVELTEQCYSNRNALPEPWVDFCGDIKILGGEGA